MTATPRKSTPADEKIGRRIKLRRKLVQMSQTELGGTIGVSFQQVQKYENGGSRIGASRLLEIARALGVEPSYFIDQKDSNNVDDTALDIFLALPEAGDIIRAVLAIESRALRRQLINVALTFAKVEKAGDAEEPAPPTES